MKWFWNDEKTDTAKHYVFRLDVKRPCAPIRGASRPDVKRPDAQRPDETSS